MFVGHYGVALAARGIEKRVPLWAWFVAVQWVDILWCVLVLLGVERVHVQPGVNPSGPLVFDYYPYTHSLLAGLFWGALAYGVGRWWLSGERRPALLLALAVLSHWVLDFLVHLPDLDLVNESYKVGLGLWRFPLPELILELALAGAGLLIYLRASPALSWPRRIALVMLCLAIVGVQVASDFGPPPQSMKAMALAGLALYLAFAGLARAVEGSARSA